ncbi:hypothetical protein P4679_23785 [Priestia megaterium]|uniref:hypothetical protein n=1 Tax=Priestia megaterium TaxID=1404 RepID=UPI002E250B45|nr:hypothetical protein [Priestia megaterium]
MARSLYDRLNYLEELEQAIRDTVEEIKTEAKKEAMTQVQDLLQKGNSDEAKKLIDEIEELKTLTPSVNIRTIHEFVLTMLDMSSEQRRFTGNNRSGIQFHYEKTVEQEDVKDVMKRKGFSFVEYVEGKLKFEKDNEYYFAIEVDEKLDTNKLESSLSNSAKFCNLVLITDSEYAKKELKSKVENWLNKAEDYEVLKKYLTIQLGSMEHLNRKGTVLERMNLA